MDDAVVLKKCPKRNSRTGQDCVDPSCSLCRGKGSYWGENLKFRKDFMFAVSAQLDLVFENKLFISEAVTGILSQVISSGMFNHGCQTSIYPCLVCGSKSRDLFAELVQQRAIQLLQQQNMQFAPELERGE